MFEIDLLKGTGVPKKFEPKTLAVSAVPFAIPALILLIALFYNTGLGIRIHKTKADIKKIEQQLTQYADDIRDSRYIFTNIDTVKICVSETACVVKQYVPFSSVLQTMVESMPDSLFLQSIDIARTTSKKQVPDRNDPTKKISVNLINRSLSMSVCDTSFMDNDVAIRQYIQRLNKSSLLKPFVKDISIDSRQDDEIDGRKVTRYDVGWDFIIKG